MNNSEYANAPELDRLLSQQEQSHFDQRAVLEVLWRSTVLGFATFSNLADNGTLNNPRLLSFTQAGDSRSYIPIFTMFDKLGIAVTKSPLWGELAFVEIEGKELLSRTTTGISLAINPWSSNEYLLSVPDIP